MKEHVMCEGTNNRTDASYLKALKATCGLSQPAMSCCKRFKNDVESIGFKVNNYDACMANKTTKGKQMATCWHG